MLSKLAYLFGIVFLAIGVLGFVPAATPDGNLLGLFAVNHAHNFVHLATGVVALLAGFSGEMWSKRFFQIFGIVYALVALMGFYMGAAPLLGMVANNMADAWLHTVIAAVSLWLGFGCCCESCHKAE